MDSIQLIRILDYLPVTSFRNAIGVSPRSLIVEGKDFRSVEQVLINDLDAPEFVVYSRTRLVAQVPDTISDAIITGVAVLSSSLTLTERSMVEFTFGTRPKKLRGILSLVQNFVRLLIRSPGSNVFHRRSGGGLLSRVGQNITNRTPADVAIAITSTRQYMINVQAAERNLPNTERLLAADIKSVTADRASTSLFVTVALTNHAGQSAAATLSM